VPKLRAREPGRRALLQRLRHPIGCPGARDGRFDDAEDAAQRSIQRLEGIDSERLAVVGMEVA
jgi:hypothetical protein